jgi:hypothetical protein
MPVPLFSHGAGLSTCASVAGLNKLAGDWWAAETVTTMTLEPLHPIQRQRFGAMSVAEKWEVAKGLLRTARETRRAVLALRHPDWSSEKIERELARELARART